MTDIRKHAFESDALWREHLQEIEEVARPVVIRPASGEHLLEDLAELRAEVAALRGRIGIRRRHGRLSLWQSIIGAAALLLLVNVAGR